MFGTKLYKKVVSPYFILSVFLLYFIFLLGRGGMVYSKYREDSIIKLMLYLEEVKSTNKKLMLIRSSRLKCQLSELFSTPVCANSLDFFSVLLYNNDSNFPFFFTLLCILQKREGAIKQCIVKCISEMEERLLWQNT